MPKVVVSVVARGHWYPEGVKRMRRAFAETNPDVEIQEWQTAPPGAPEEVIEDGWDYTGYVWKPFALKHALDSGADVAIQLDAAFWPIRSIQPLVDHILETGYYLCNNGFKVGEWASDRCLEWMRVDREFAFDIPEASSYCIGVSTRNLKAKLFVNAWEAWAQVRGVFEGPHTATGGDGRNEGFVSTDARVKGHRHDQTVASIVAHRLGMRDLINRPRFTAYEAGYGGHADETTVLLNRGI